MTDKRTTKAIPQTPLERKPKGGKREGAGRPELDPASKRKARQIYATDAGWAAARAHVAALGHASLGDWAESLK